MAHDSLSELMAWLSGSSVGLVKVAQTTYFEFVVAAQAEGRPPRRGRVHYRGKVRQSKIGGEFAGLSLFDEHPLCVPYEEARGRVAFHRGPRDGARLIDEMQVAASDVLMDWVSLQEFLNPYYRDGARLTADAYGELLDAPMTVVDAVLPMLSASGLEFRVFESHRRQPPVRALTMGRMYVVAAEFRGEALNAAAQ